MSSDSESLTGVVHPHAHDFAFVVDGAGNLLLVVCEGCGGRWRLEPIGDNHGYH